MGYPINKWYKDSIEKVVEEIKNLPESSRLSGDDSGLDDVWKEYCNQIQGEHSPFYGLYEEIVQKCCDDIVRKLTDAEVEVLWEERNVLYCQDDDYHDEQEIGIGWKRNDVAVNLFRQVDEKAANEDLGGR